MAEALPARFRAGLLTGFALGLPSFISACGLGGIRKRTPIKRLVSWIRESVMSDPKDDDWPSEQHRLAPNNYLAALGQVTFTYNMLESMMRNIFERCSPLEESFAKRLFHNLNNRDRCDLLSAFVNKNEQDSEVREAVLYCILCYDICTDNRNILMHSIYFNPNPNVTLLVKRAASDPFREIHFDVPVADLRRIADETVETFKYALNLFAFVARRKFLAEQGPTSPVHAHPNVWRNPLPEKPPKPRKLTPLPPVVVRRDDPLLPQSSGA